MDTETITRALDERDKRVAATCGHLGTTLASLADREAALRGLCELASLPVDVGNPEAAATLCDELLALPTDRQRTLARSCLWAADACEGEPEADLAGAAGLVLLAAVQRAETVAAIQAQLALDDEDESVRGHLVG